MRGTDRYRVVVHQTAITLLRRTATVLRGRHRILPNGHYIIRQQYQLLSMYEIAICRRKNLSTVALLRGSPFNGRLCASQTDQRATPSNRQLRPNSGNCAHAYFGKGLPVDYLIGIRPKIVLLLAEPVDKHVDEHTHFGA
jgi:hypothetical protein